jgi:hypothetical protein
VVHSFAKASVGSIFFFFFFFKKKKLILFIFLAPYYLPPEMIKDELYNFKSNIFIFVVLILFIYLFVNVILFKLVYLFGMSWCCFVCLG